MSETPATRAGEWLYATTCGVAKTKLMNANMRYGERPAGLPKDATTYRVEGSNRAEAELGGKQSKRRIAAMTSSQETKGTSSERKLKKECMFKVGDYIRIKDDQNGRTMVRVTSIRSYDIGGMPQWELDAATPDGKKAIQSMPQEYFVAAELGPDVCPLKEGDLVRIKHEFDGPLREVTGITALTSSGPNDRPWAVSTLIPDRGVVTFLERIEVFDVVTPVEARKDFVAAGG